MGEVVDEPALDEVTQLEIALILTGGGVRRGGGNSGGAARSTDEPPDTRLLACLDPADRDRLRRQAEDLAGRGVRAVLRGGAGYPSALSKAGNGPRALFCRGPLDVLDRSGVGICGSRNASSEGLRAASLFGTLSARRGMSSISGYARGVDIATHVAGLEAGGYTVLVLPAGIDHFRIQRDDVRNAWDPARALVLSQFAPTQPWTVHGAMARNGTVIGLSAALVVVEAGEKGGTLAAGRRALALGRRVLVLEFAASTQGNQELLAAGAIAVRDRIEFEELLHDLEHVVDERDQRPAPDAFHGCAHRLKTVGKRVGGAGARDGRRALER